jgi:hypothetical protein
MERNCSMINLFVVQKSHCSHSKCVTPPISNSFRSANSSLRKYFRIKQSFSWWNSDFQFGLYGRYILPSHRVEYKRTEFPYLNIICPGHNKPFINNLGFIVKKLKWKGDFFSIFEQIYYWKLNSTQRWTGDQHGGKFIELNRCFKGGPTSHKICSQNFESLIAFLLETSCQNH